MERTGITRTAFIGRVEAETTIAPQVLNIKALALWKEWMEVSYSPSTTRNYLQVVTRFMLAYPVPLDEVTEEMVVAWLGQFPYRSSSRRTYYQALKSFCRLANRRLWVLVDPTASRES